MKQNIGQLHDGGGRARLATTFAYVEQVGRHKSPPLHK